MIPSRPLVRTAAAGLGVVACLATAVGAGAATHHAHRSTAHGTATTGTITGNVTSTGGPVAGQCVTAFDVNGNGYPGVATTGANGSFRITDLPPGAYALQTDQCSNNGNADDGFWVPSYYKNDPGLYRNGATAVTVTAGAVTKVPFKIELGGGITVHAQYAGGAPISGAVVCPNFVSVQNQNSYCAFTDSSGDVTITGVPAGANRIGVYDPATSVQYFYGDTPAFWASPTVTVTQLSDGPTETVTLPAPTAGARRSAPAIGGLHGVVLQPTRTA